MGLLGEILSAIDNRKRVAANSVRGLLADPVGHMGLLGARYAEQNLPTMREAQDAESVMPGMGDPFRQKIENLAMNSGLLGMTVYHGSPHRFDKFDASKIGTGEGAQAYGHGLYFAEKPSVAQSYRDNLTGQTKYYRLSNDGGKWQVWDSSWNKVHVAPTKQAAEQFVESLSKEEGALYKVDLPDDAIAKMLDWDAPLSKQPKAVREISKLFGKEEVRQMAPRLGGKQDPEPLGRDIYDSLTKKFNNNQRATSAYLRDSLGIPGIKYLDAGSRGAGTGTRNFVVFPGNEGLLKILERE